MLMMFIIITFLITVFVYGTFTFFDDAKVETQLDRIDAIDSSLKHRSGGGGETDKENADGETGEEFKQGSQKLYQVSRFKIGFFMTVFGLLSLCVIRVLYMKSASPTDIILVSIALLGLWAYIPRWLYWVNLHNLKNSIIYNFPNTIDLLNICLKAGISFNQSFNHVAHEISHMSPILSGEFMRVTREINAGKKREEALKDMSKRLDVDEVRVVVSNLIQAEKMGGSVAANLSVQAETLRDKYKQSVRARIAKVPIKMIFPMVFFLLPAIMIVILGPAMFSITMNLTGR